MARLSRRLPLLPRRLARLTCATVVAAALVTLQGGSASAGGWAIASLDAMPDAVPGGSVDVGFTVLQHGVRPVDLAGDVGVEVTMEDGAVLFFPARGDGAPGHHVATVEFPVDEGTYEWAVRMAEFGVQSLGSLHVYAGGPGVSGAGVSGSGVNGPGVSGAGGSGSGGSVWPIARWAMVTLTGVLAAVALVDIVAARRKRVALP